MSVGRSPSSMPSAIARAGVTIGTSRSRVTSSSARSRRCSR
jgi:hypothetical protein